MALHYISKRIYFQILAYGLALLKSLFGQVEALTPPPLHLIILCVCARACLGGDLNPTPDLVLGNLMILTWQWPSLLPKSLASQDQFQGLTKNIKIQKTRNPIKKFLGTLKLIFGISRTIMNPILHHTKALMCSTEDTYLDRLYPFIHTPTIAPYCC